MEDQFVVTLNDNFVCITPDYNEAKEFYDKQIENWKEYYKDKPIDKNDKLILKNYSTEQILYQFKTLDLL